MHIRLLVYSLQCKITTKVGREIMHAVRMTFSTECAKNFEYRFQFLQVIED